jgi:hypothetical protein
MPRSCLTDENGQNASEPTLRYASAKQEGRILFPRLVHVLWIVPLCVWAFYFVRVWGARGEDQFLMFSLFVFAIWPNMLICEIAALSIAILQKRWTLPLKAAVLLNLSGLWFLTVILRVF